MKIAAWVSRFLDAIVRRWPRLPLIFLRLAERVHGMIAMLSTEPAEVVNIVCAASFLGPLLLNPNYLSTSPYLAHIAVYLSPTGAKTLFFLLLLYWVVMLAFGGPPSGMIDHVGHLRKWTLARMTGLGFGIIAWGTAAILLSLSQVGGGTFLYGAAAITSGVVQVVMGYRSLVDKAVLQERAERGRQTNNARKGNAGMVPVHTRVNAPVVATAQFSNTE